VTNPLLSYINTYADISVQIEPGTNLGVVLEI
jgi:hypothetical protein